MPKISIIIPNYNRADLLPETLRSIKRQTFEDWECIVVDDRSTDTSREEIHKFVRKDDRFRLFVRTEEQIKGAPTCRNLGFEQSLGEIVYFFDSDDILSPEFLAEASKRMDAAPQAEYAVAPFDSFIESPDKPVTPANRYSVDDDLFEQLVSRKIGLSTQKTLWRRSLLERSDLLWREGLQKGQDEDFSFRMISLPGAEGIWLDMPPMIHYRLHDGQMGVSARSNRKNGKTVMDNTAKIYFILLESGKMTPERKAMHMKGFLKRNLIMAMIYGNREGTRNAYRFIRDNTPGLKNSRFFRLYAYGVYLLTPVLYFFGSAASRYRKSRPVRWFKETFLSAK